MDLHERLKGQSTSTSRVDLHAHIIEVRKKAESEWLKGITKNGIEHSKRLEGYLNRLIPDDFKKRLNAAEIFILLYGICLHDIGYRTKKGDKEVIEGEGHPLRSKNYILQDPDKYLFGPFRLPSMKPEDVSFVAQAVADVCYGHAHEKVCSLKDDIDNDFRDQDLCVDGRINLRRLAALLRAADEADQAYGRLDERGVRKYIKYPETLPGVIRLYWKGDAAVGKAVSEEAQKIKEVLEAVNDCLSDWENFPKIAVVLDPELPPPPPPPTEPIDYKKGIPDHYIQPRCHDEKGDDKGLLDNYVQAWLNDPKRKLLAVLGDYGIGKTSFCYKFAADLAGSQFIPVVIELKRVREKNLPETIQEAIDRRVPQGSE
jgi:hypothetical protein